MPKNFFSASAAASRELTVPFGAEGGSEPGLECDCLTASIATELSDFVSSTLWPTFVELPLFLAVADPETVVEWASPEIPEIVEPCTLSDADAAAWMLLESASVVGTVVPTGPSVVARNERVVSNMPAGASSAISHFDTS